MHEIAILTRRELHSYFTSPIAYVFGTLFLGGQMWLSSMGLQQGAVAAPLLFFTFLPQVFLFLLPALTMRLWSEERKLGTLELLLTFPVRISQLVLGKFLAALAFLTLLMAMTTILPITMSFYGDVDWGPVIAAYLGSMLMASAYLSVGMFWSSMTRDQIIAMLLSLATLMALYALGLPALLLFLSQSGKVPEFVVSILGAISPYRYFLSIARGVLDSRDLIYYLCFCGFFLYANALVLQARKVKG